MSRIRVLVVDDDKLVRKGLISVMPWADFGMDVIGEANNGEKALDFIHGNAVDLLLTDLAMPVMSGIELMREVRKRYPHIHIVVLTLHQDFEYIQEALRLGAIDYIAKVQLEKERFDQVLERIAERIRESGGPAASNKERDVFYDVEPGMQVPGTEVAAAGAGLISKEEGALPGYTEESLIRLKSDWSSPDWIRQDALFLTLTETLKQLRLPEAKLIGLLYSLIDEWNRLFEPLGISPILLPETLVSWLDTEKWLQATRDKLRQALTRSTYSMEVVEAVMKAKQLAHEELDRSVTAAELARRVNMSRGYFSQCFKDLIGRTFNDYLRHIRMEKAKELLLYTRKPIHWVAEQTGYSDEKYFSRTFREHTGLLPSEFRQTRRGDLEAGREMSGK